MREQRLPCRGIEREQGIPDFRFVVGKQFFKFGVALADFLVRGKFGEAGKAVDQHVLGVDLQAVVARVAPVEKAEHESVEHREIGDGVIGGQRVTKP